MTVFYKVLPGLTLIVVIWAVVSTDASSLENGSQRFPGKHQRNDTAKITEDTSTIAQDYMETQTDPTLTSGETEDTTPRGNRILNPGDLPGVPELFKKCKGGKKRSKKCRQLYKTLDASDFTSSSTDAYQSQVPIQSQIAANNAYINALANMEDRYWYEVDLMQQKIDQIRRNKLEAELLHNRTMATLKRLLDG